MDTSRSSFRREGVLLMATLNSSSFTYKGGIADIVEKYKFLAQMGGQNICRKVTERLDKRLVQRLKEKSPKDTTLLSQSWIIPEQYLNTHKGEKWEVYVLNTATVGKQRALKYAQEGKSPKGKLTGRHNLKRYAKWVNASGKNKGFYDKQLRVIRQEIPGVFKAVLYEELQKILEYKGYSIAQRLTMFGDLEPFAEKYRDRTLED